MARRLFLIKDSELLSPVATGDVSKPLTLRPHRSPVSPQRAELCGVDGESTSRTPLTGEQVNTERVKH